MANSTTRQLPNVTAIALAAAAVGCFHVACLVEPAGVVVVLYLASIYALAWVKTARWAFYLGLGIGMMIAAPQLWFFQVIFGPAAVGLWAILGVWVGLFLLLSHLAVRRWPVAGRWMIPVFWLSLEYFRSELYPLRFAWLTPGTCLSNPQWSFLASMGVYGFSFLVLLTLVVLDSAQIANRRTLLVFALLPASLFFLPGRFADSRASNGNGPYVTGIQLEGPTVPEVIEALNRARQDNPETDLYVLSEYTFDDVPPPEILSWCREHRCHLIAGGKDPVPGESTFRNTAFVVSPEGEIVFRQSKSVPVQFMSDGLPAQSQALWESPWGRIGIAICYDLSYSRVVDRLIELGAEALIVPTMDAEDWGPHEHWLHAKIAPIRAKEYGVPIVRLASSGISQLVHADGTVSASAPIPGQGERLKGTLPLSSGGRRPLDRYLALPAIAATGCFLVFLGFDRFRKWRIPS